MSERECYGEIMRGPDGPLRDRQGQVICLEGERAIERCPQAAPAVGRDEILAQLAANDLRAIRALLEGDTARLDAIRAEQMALRAKLAQNGRL